jgi:hypothetical protein
MRERADSPRRATVVVRAAALLVALGLASACSATGNPAVAVGSESSTTVSPLSTTTIVPGVDAPTTVPPTTTTTVPPPPVRSVTEQAWTPFATVGGVTLHHPSRRVERVGFHQSNHEGARQLSILPTAVAPETLETRERLTSARTAADVVSDPNVEIRAPVTGRVKRAGTYVLYCKHSDDYLVIEPDDHPGWEVKLLHIDGVRVRAGDRVTARQTVVAPRPTKLPFESQVDELSDGKPWPHVHIEVVDPSIPNKPSPGSGC